MRKSFFIIYIVAIACSCGTNNNPVLSEASGVENGHDYADLGLSVMWATTNVGADTPEEYGGWFAWAETAEKDYYDWKTYKYGKSATTLTKYNTSEKNGKVDNILTLEADDDAATVNWGGRWRTPTKEEWQELVDKCKWEAGTLNGVKGFYFTAGNGNSIFLPLAGAKKWDELGVAGEWGLYCSASLCDTEPPHVPTPYKAWSLELADDDDGKDIRWISGSRPDGHSFRAVFTTN